MSLWVKTCLGLAAFLVTTLLFGAAVPLEVPGKKRADDDVRGGKYFHEGKTLPGGRKDPSCQPDACHADHPHERNATLSAFRNMHVQFTDCLSCHGANSPNRWILTSPIVGGDPGFSDRRVRIRYTVPPTDG